MKASNRGHLKAMDLLIRHGADITITDKVNRERGYLFGDEKLLYVVVVVVVVVVSEW